jgi:hypothetical protein
VSTFLRKLSSPFPKSLAAPPTKNEMPESLSSAIEVHDSVLNSVERTGTGLQLFIEAYIHKSKGTPGVDPGTGWTQDVLLIIEDGSFDGTIENPPWDLADGTLQINDQVLDNMIPIPLDQRGQREFTLIDQRSGNRIVARGTRISLKLLGEAK